MKTLTFEGAGYAKAAHNGVGNCRIRTTFKNKFGREIYLELTGHAPHKYSPDYMKNYNFAGFVSHLFYTSDQKLNYSLRFSKIERITFEYTKESILSLVNGLEIEGDFTDINVNNENYNGFKLEGTK